MRHHPGDTAILIPSYQPGEALAPYAQALLDAGFGRIVVVDDGSGPGYAGIFNSLPSDERCTLITCAQNGGKGVALKRGMRYLLDECPDCAYVVTADCDGQHTIQDTLRLCDSLHEDASALWLGVRDFTLSNVPTRSLLGNRATSLAFYLLYGVRIRDTQTGLRGFPRAMIEALCAVKGSRYEYEMNVLIYCAMTKVAIKTITIETVYENNNEGSHYRTVRDSLRILRVIMAGFIRFISSSALCFGVDYALYLLFNQLFKSYVPAMEAMVRILSFHMLGRILAATALARIVSGVLNFIINKRYVFIDHSSKRKSFPKYLCVFFLVMFLSAFLTSGAHLTFGWSDNTAKIPVDLLLFFLSYQLQNRWVFPNKKPAR